MTMDEYLAKSAAWTKAAEREARRLGFTFLDHGHDTANGYRCHRISIRSYVPKKSHLAWIARNFPTNP